MLETKRINIVVNGETRSVPEGLTLSGVLMNLGLEPDRVAIEKDRTIVKKAAWDATVVESGAELEIVQFVGGG